MCFSVFSPSSRRPIRTTHSHCFDKRSARSSLSVALTTTNVTFAYNARVYSCQLFQDLSGFNRPEGGDNTILHGTTIQNNTTAATSIEAAWQVAFIFILICLIYMKVISCNYNWWLNTLYTVYSLSISSMERNSAARKNFMCYL